MGLDFVRDFTLDFIDVGDATIRVRHGGAGPAVVLLHGHPRTHLTWWRVAPKLADAGFCVVCPDLRGYGQSSKPPTTEDHAPYSKRAMGNDVVAVMRHLGHDMFCLAGHDRGSYVAYRTALDHPDAVRKLVVLDGVPLLEAVERCNAKFAEAWWHWWFFGQTEKPAEDVINRDPDAWYTGGSVERMGEHGFADWQAAIRNPETVHAMVEDYRAGISVDCDNDRADRDAGRQITCPTLFTYSEQDDMVELYGDPLAIWKHWATDVRGDSVDCGHHIAEEAPDELAQVLARFFRD